MDEFLAVFSAYTVHSSWGCEQGMLREVNERQDCPLTAVWNSLHPDEAPIIATDQKGIESAWVGMGMSRRDILRVQYAADTRPYRGMAAVPRRLRAALVVAAFFNEKVWL